MKKRFFVLAALVGMSAGAMAQKKGFDYTFYGQVRTDVFYNSRSNSETVDGLFYMYPKDVNPDADGKKPISVVPVLLILRCESATPISTWLGMVRLCW